ncbi:MAG TPA: DUF4412 domain-containing protein [Saprospiraceae bacterium]|nr:DUF4412 domain-containing protein [Saprospiraceae bacterium]
MRKSIFLFLLAFASFSIGVAQDAMSDVSIVMEITKVESDDPQIGMQLEMMKGSKTEMYIKGKKSMTKMDMMGGMIKMNMLSDEETDNMDMTFDAMGQKMWINSKVSESKNDPAKKAVIDGAKIDVDKSKTKTIAGYDCYLVKVSSKENPDMSFETYVTEKLVPNSNMLQGFEGVQLPGFPLEYTLVNPMLRLTSTAKQVKMGVDDTKFGIKTDGFKKITMDEFKTMMGGFGF